MSTGFRELRVFSLRRNLIALLKRLEGGCSRWVQVTSDRRHGVKVCQWMLRLDIRRNFSTARVIKHCNGLPRDVVESGLLAVLKERLDGHGTWSS